MRLGVGLDLQTEDPEEIACAYVAAGYSAAVCPRVRLDQPERIKAIRSAFQRQDVLLAELGAWNNMLDPDPAQRAANLQANQDALALADEVGAVCCVNIAGSFNPTAWDGPHPNNLSEAAFDRTVENVRGIIDAVQPRRTRYCLETMPWVIPDSPASYRALVDAIDRPAFGVHLDPVNLVNSPARYYRTGDLIRECFEMLGPWIISCHAKDILLRERLTVHLDEVRPGLGGLDYEVFLRQLSRLADDLPLMLEHLPQKEYPAAREHLLAVARREGVSLKAGRQASI